MKIAAKCKLCRRSGEKLFLKGERCQTPKCAMVKRNYPPGSHGQKRRRRLSSYGIHLREKQKVRYMYALTETQLRNYMKKAMNKKGNTGQLFLQQLESRLDNVIYKLGLAASRIQARQIITHGHIQINGKKVSFPSYQVSPKEAIQIRKKSLESDFFKNLKKKIEKHQVPSWLDLDKKELKGKVINQPQEKDLELGIQTQLLVEFYAK
ncbi:MAG: 30S ribosomal protein S4 [Patescibacteria group bacterium]|nr:30S ribosomal protein S4 [Patescibacteria group bacterium]